MEFCCQKNGVFYKIGNFFYILSLLVPIIILFFAFIALIEPHLPKIITKISTIISISISIVLLNFVTYRLGKYIFKREEQIEKRKLKLKIIEYLITKNFTMISFKKLRSLFNIDYDDDWFVNL